MDTPVSIVPVQMTDRVSNQLSALSATSASSQEPRVVLLAAGAAGMYCGSCLRDNRLAATLIKQGRDAMLIPLYTPLKTDEPNASTGRVYYGGISVYLDQVSRLFRRLPTWSTRILDARFLLRGIAGLASRTRPDDLGPLTVAVLEGAHGPQRRELDTLVNALEELRPDLINLPNLMFVGVAEELRRALGVPVVCTLSGEDIFLDAIPDPHRTRAVELIRQNAIHVNGFVAVTDYFADHAVTHFGLPRDRMHVVPMGIHTDAFAHRPDPAGRFTVGYLARVCGEKGLALLVDAMIRLRDAGRDCAVRAAGYLSAADRAYLNGIVKNCRRAGHADAFSYVGEVSWAEKLAFLETVHALSVPTVYKEAKGFYILEAMAAGVPVIQPRHGSFPELINATGGGLLFEPGSAAELAKAIARLMDDAALRTELGTRGRKAVHGGFTETHMADRTWALYKRMIEEHARAQ